MRATRQDGWNQKDDSILATNVIEYIKTGKTQLEAFEIVGKHLKRTPAACGFRWNSFLRKQYTNEIQEAKALRMTLRGRQQSPSFKHNGIENDNISFDDVLKSLVLIKQKLNNLNRENKELREKVTSTNTLTNDDVQKMFLVLQQVIKNQENEKEMPTG
jgi:RsfA family transcription factor